MLDRLPARDAPPLRGAVLMSQRWDDVAFLDWAVDPALVAPHLPPGTRPDLLDGLTRVSLVPFTLRGAAPGSLPGVPHLGTFLETNVRFYSVDDAGRRGVVFASLDASRLAVVLGARAVFGLPYRWSRLHRAERFRDGARELVWTCRTRGRRPVTSRVALRVGEPLPDPGDAAVFTSARYGLHVAHRGRTWWIANEHEPWPLRSARVLHLDDGLLAAAGFGALAARPPDGVAFADRVSTRFAPPRPLVG